MIGNSRRAARGGLDRKAPDANETFGRGVVEEPDLIVRGSPSAIAGYVYAGAPLSSIDVEGDTKLAAKLPSFFPMPEKAALSAA